VIATRTYDLSICYDKYYRTPRVYLFGYSERRQPLSPDQLMEDVSGEHKHKTVRIESHPHVNVQHVSIHPCNHAHVMKRIVDQMTSAMESSSSSSSSSSSPPAAAAAAAAAVPEVKKQYIRVDQYLFLFLKFIATVIPTIEYDYTFSI
jgi:ubiquitin-like-conjugating enzyme ATG3